MTKARLETFSDGVIAILITIMVLDLKVPHGADWESLAPRLPLFLSYVLSYTFLGIYWNNHHHMLHSADHINGKILWANLHLLFWLSLIPFTTGWMGENHAATLPTALYGVVLLMAAIAYQVLQGLLVVHQGPASRLKDAVGNDTKGKLSLVCYVIAVPVALSNQLIAIALYVFVAMLWIIPDRRIESRLGRS